MNRSLNWHRPRRRSTLDVLIRAGVCLTTTTLIWAVILIGIAP